MFAALSAKTALFAVLLTTLASISIAQEEGSVKFILSIQKPTSHPNAGIEFERTDSNIKWFNDSVKSIDSSLIYGLTIPINDSNVNYRKHIIQGVHNGEALKKECIFVSCFWVSDSLISGLESNTEVHYQIDNNELWLDKPLHIGNTSSITMSPLVGVNIAPVEFAIYDTDNQESRSITSLIPFWGINLKKQLSNAAKVTAEFHHLNYDGTGWGLLYQNYQIGIERRMTKSVDISMGYSKYRLRAEFDKNSKDAKVNLSSNSPFIQISIHF